MNFGLKNESIEKINSVFLKYAEIESAIIYGSRAKGNFHHGSDIDLTLKGNKINLNTLLIIENELDDLLLPYQIDLSIYEHIENQELLTHINRIGKIFYLKK